MSFTQREERLSLWLRICHSRKSLHVPMLNFVSPRTFHAQAQPSMFPAVSLTHIHFTPQVPTPGLSLSGCWYPPVWSSSTTSTAFFFFFFNHAPYLSLGHSLAISHTQHWINPKISFLMSPPLVVEQYWRQFVS